MKTLLSTAAIAALLIAATGCTNTYDNGPQSLSGDASSESTAGYISEGDLGPPRPGAMAGNFGQQIGSTPAPDDRNAVAVNDEVNRQAVNAADKVTAETITDDLFVTKATIGGMYEVQAGQLALQKSQTQNIRDIANKIVTDHTAANEKLKALANQKGMTLPTSLDAKHQAMYDKLNGLDGTAFDSEFTTQQIAAHQKAVALFQAQAAGGKDADLKKFASDTVTTLQGHLDMLTRKSNEKLNVGSTPVMPK